MRILVIGGTGTIGGAVVDALSPRHEVVAAGRSSGDRRVDIASEESIRAFFDEVGRFDALVSAAGAASFEPLAELDAADFRVGLDSKLMGQVGLVLLGLPHVADGGSFTLTSGVLAAEPISGSAAVSVANAGVEAFARAAALEMPRGVRINAVSPPWVRETLEAMGRDPSPGMPAAEVAKAYVASLEGDANGEVIDARRVGGR